MSSALPRDMPIRAWRIADRRHPIFDGTGARLFGGRWNSPGHSLIYASENYAGAILEILVHTALGRIPGTHAFVQIDIPASVAIESLDPAGLPGWDAEDQIVSRAFGDRWLAEARSAVLLVPGLVTGGLERNILLNPLHPAFASITASSPQDVRWDSRLFPRQPRPRH